MWRTLMEAFGEMTPSEIIVGLAIGLTLAAIIVWNPEFKGLLSYLVNS